MAKTKISEFSSTPANNTDIDSINIAEGCAPSNINDAIRELMAQLKDFQIGSQGDSFNGPIGTTTASTGAFTTLSASSTLSVTGAGSIQGLTVGRGAGAVSTNTAVGASAMANMTSSGFFDVAIGYNALYTSTGGIANNAIGYRAMYATTTGANSQALGASALAANTTGSFLVAVGDSALAANTTGNNSIAIGQSALQSNTTANNNTAVGYQAGYSNTTNGANTFFGSGAGYTSTGSYNSCFGYQAGYGITTGTNNTFVGTYVSGLGGVGSLITTGSKNTIIGGYNGNQGGLDIRTSNNIVVLSDGDGQLLFLGYGSAITGRYIINDGGYFYCATDNVMGLGASSKRWTTVYATTGTINTSDVNQKQDIAALDDAEKRVAIAIKSLIKKYRFKDAVAEKGDSARIHVGAVAQEVQAAFAAEGLDPTRYALFCSDTWYEVDGQPSQKASEPFTAETPNAVEVTRLGLRYDELLAFVIASI